MCLKQLIFLLAILAFWSPAIATASEIEVQAGDVRITTERDSRGYVNPRWRWRRSPYTRFYSDWDRYTRSRSNRVSCSRRGSVVRQESTQVTRSGRSVTRSHTSTYCR